ncbi:phage integrase [Aeromonas veronii]|uniref:phage integrase n=1 Tax=Aeromonas TaxID=642 RepID=UPI002B474A27|nr:tyrosine-type recombinase/integrase [Aeromonas veronii]
MTVRKLDDGKPKLWLAEVYPQGREGPRKRKRFATKGEALAWERFTLDEHQAKPWLGQEVKEHRTLQDLIDLWFKLHGQTLKRQQVRLAKLQIICNGMGNPKAIDVTPKMWAHYRAKRMAGEIDNGWNVGAKKAITARTVNQELAFLKAVFGELIRLGEWLHPHPLQTAAAVKTPDPEMTFLQQWQIADLLSAAQRYPNPDLALIIKICLATGARWREAESLTTSQVTPYRITYTNTKGNKNRTVPISKALYDELLTGNKSGQLFQPCYLDFGRALKTTGIELPDGQLTHVLRHSFASHFMMNGGNILVLQKILGHANIRDTMRYAHFAPDHLEEAARLNPLEMWRQNGGTA